MDMWRAWWPARPRRLSPAEHERVLAVARIERHGGLATLYLAGTPYEMGYQHGVLARDLIHGFRQAAYLYVTSLVRGSVRPDLPAWLVRPLLFYQAASYWPTIPAEYVQEIQGIADGAGVHPIEVLVSTAIWEIYLVSGCSEFAVTGPITTSDTLLHGYNYDLMHPDHALSQPYLAALFYRPDEGIPFVTVNTVGSVGVNAGMNEAGISVAWDNTYLRDEKLTRHIEMPVAPFIITLRRLLQYAHSLDEGVGIVTGSLPRPLGDIVIVGSAGENRAVALETAGRQHAVRQMEDGAVWSTNCFRSPELAPHDRRGDGRRLQKPVAWRRFPRYTAYDQLFAAHWGQLSPETAAAFLRDPYPREAEGFVYPNPAPRVTICRDITSWSLVMEPGEGRIWISDTAIPAPQGRFFAFDLPSWQRLPDRDLVPTGYRAALRCAELFLGGDRRGAQAALEEAVSLDGPAAPLMLMQAVLHGLEGDGAAATETLEQVAIRWEGTDAGALARAWLAQDRPSEASEASEGTESPPPIPFPSAIRALVHLHPAGSWAERAIPATV
ncbi:MAG TPA: C45 family peptidase [Anaerolineae bacterium]|nr:C45 family peptidase [Anaerolineae bacterium]